MQGNFHPFTKLIRRTFEKSILDASMVQNLVTGFPLANGNGSRKKRAQHVQNLATWHPIGLFGLGSEGRSYSNGRGAEPLDQGGAELLN